MLATGVALAFGAPVLAQTAAPKAEAAAQGHGADKRVYQGYFEDSQIEARPLSDWAGDWQSVYPRLLDGTLDPVMAHKAEHGDKTAEEYRAYYATGYKTDVDGITIAGDEVTFYRGSQGIKGVYDSDGYEVLTYEKGNRGVRYIFRKIGGEAAAPGFIQFSDHQIVPEKSGHYHLYWGEDRAVVLRELTNWPTYYPAALGREEIVTEMLAH